MLWAERGVLHRGAQQVPILKEPVPLFFCPGLLPIADKLKGAAVAHPLHEVSTGPCELITISSLHGYQEKPPGHACSQFTEQQTLGRGAALRQQTREITLDIC